MNESKPNFTQAFSEQKTKLRPYAITASIATLAIIIGSPILFLLNARATFLTVHLTIFLVILLACIPSIIKASHCPNCQKYMGKSIGKFCSLCGVQLQK